MHSDLGAKRQIPEDGDDLVDHYGRTNRPADHHVHPLLSVRLDLVVDREEL